VTEPRFKVIAPNASPAEAAAIAAALEQFIAETTPVAESARQAQSGWLKAALEEGVGRSQLSHRLW
jgi:hypothetical protein